MYPKTFVFFMILNITIAHKPVIFHKDNSESASEPMKLSLRQHRNITPGNYPYYEVVTSSQSITDTKEVETLKTDSDRLPVDLIEIAKTQLGIKNLNEIPTLSELGNILGTTSHEETIETIRELTETKSGIDLIKAFIESSDFTDNTDSTHIQIDADTSKPLLPTVFLSETTQKDLDIIKKVLPTTQQDLGFFQRIGSYLKIFDFFPQNKDIAVSTSEKDLNQARLIIENKNHESHHQRPIDLQPISITNRFPNSFPVPYRSVVVSPTKAPSTYRAMKGDDIFLSSKL